MPKEMDVFFSQEKYELFEDDRDKSLCEWCKYTPEDKLDFNWIHNQGHKIAVLAEDLYEFTKKFNLHENKLDPKIEKQLADLEKERPEILKKL